jgi:hypothetical protein
MQGPVVRPNAAFRKALREFGEPAFKWLPPESDQESERLRINVLFTTPRETQLALKRAVELSAGLDAEIFLIVPQIVPFPLDIDNPPVPLGFASHQLYSLVESIDAELDGHIYLCRDRLETFLRVLRANSVTVLGMGRRWFFSRSERLAKALRRGGHQVILAKSA